LCLQTIANSDWNIFLFAGLRDYLRRLRQRNKLICYWLVRLTGSPPSFTFRGKRYRHFWHRYNATWRNERAVEIPIALDFIRAARGGSILEVGNVLSHYVPVWHEVVDKYEKAAGVQNEDICDFRPGRKYDLILSISTLEHVGFDEGPTDETKVLRAFKNLRCLLAPNGKLVATIPLGYNPALDRLIEEGSISFTECAYLKRMPDRNQWREAGAWEVRNPYYDRTACIAHELFIGIFDNSDAGTGGS